MRFHRPVLVLLLALLVLDADLNLFAQLNPRPHKEAQNSAPAGTGGSSADEYDLQKYAQLLSELTSRRRANVYFVNQQSAFHGAQVSYVNMGTGNLTFARRDMVVPGRVPIMLARVYDSSRREKTDFGQGWMLSAAERIVVDGETARLIDETGSELEFAIRGNELLLKRDFPTDYVRLLRSNGSINATLRDGSTKTYAPIEGQYRLTSFTDRNGNQLGIKYKGGSVTRLENATHAIDLVRNDRGLIIAAVDDSNRKVVYEYDREGSLATVRDLGDGLWRYEYEGKGLLKAAYDPAGRNSFRVMYSDINRVAKLQSPSGTIQYQYEPGQNLTTVVDRKLLRSRYFQNNDGVTTRVVNALGEESRVELDSANNVVALFRNGSLTDSMRYDDQHRLYSARRSPPTARPPAPTTMPRRQACSPRFKPATSSVPFNTICGAMCCEQRIPRGPLGLAFRPVAICKTTPILELV